MGHWDIRWVSKSSGPEADKYSEMIAASMLKAIRETDAVAWEQFRAILRELVKQ